ncbi:uncharacterized protein SCHCODRAFT_02501600 [Schizophyllum commune H4-8]|nr:uncharacterized protein SCHCODRAFT_02501600 [Schizophyllum commune H4-8]KAI5893455.1 hypothetical protein SCHCODRAFT_02501600 [Schizophyllum commune H4-8]
MFYIPTPAFSAPTTFISFGAAQDPREAYDMFRDASQALRPLTNLPQSGRRSSVSSTSSTSSGSAKGKSSLKKLFGGM